MRRLLLPSLLLLAACGPGEPAKTPAPAPTGSATPEAKPLSLALRAVKTSDRQALEPLRKDASARSGEFIAYYVKPDRDVYVYVVQFFADGTQALIFPKEQDERIPGGVESRVPTKDTQWLRLREGTEGAEHLYVIATPKPIAELDRELASVIAEVRVSASAPAPGAPEPQPAAVPAASGTVLALAPAGSAPAASAPPPSAPPPPAPPPAPRPVARPPAGGMAFLATRSVDLVDFEESYVATAGPDGIVVLHFPFQHEK